LLIKKAQLFESLRKQPDAEKAAEQAKEAEERERVYLMKAQQRVGELVRIVIPLSCS
jgi:hypothetical protein